MSSPRPKVLLVLSWYSEALHEGALKYGTTHGVEIRLVTPENLAKVTAEPFHGILCALPGREHPFFRLVSEAKIPVVELSYAHPEYTEWGRFPSDHGATGRLAAEHLRSRPVAGFVFTSYGPWPGHDARWVAFRDALAGDPRPCVRFDIAASEPDAVPRLAKFLKEGAHPAGIFGSVDQSALLALEAAQFAGLNVPGDAYIIGFGSRQLVSGLAPVPISSISIDYRTWGYEAMGMLLDMMNGTVARGALRLFPPSGLDARASTDGEVSGDPLCARAIELMRSRVSDPFDVAGLARALGVSASTLHRAFDTHLGTSVAARYLALRLDVAKGLILSGLKVDAVAASVGFASVRAFRSAFRNAFACSPTEFTGRESGNSRSARR